MIEPTLTLLLIFLAVGMCAGFFDAISGGGGLLTVPALLLAGVPPLIALGTNKFQGLFGTASATLSFAKKGHLDLRSNAITAFLCFIASVVGAYIASFVPQKMLGIALPIVLIGVALYFALGANLTDKPRVPLISKFALAGFALPFVGLYDGVFGPGAGSFYMLMLLGLGGLGVLQATAQTKLFNFASNLGGFIGFALIGAVAWKIGIAMAVGQVIGANLGAQMAIKKGATLIRPLLVTICILTALKLLFAS